MGSPVQVTVTASKKNADAFASEVAESIAQLDHLISKKEHGSEISRINRDFCSVLAPGAVNYIEQCVKLSEQTGGAFDITVGALSQLWDFDGEKRTVPAKADIALALETVGYEKIKLEGDAVSIPSGTVLDLGAAGKGLACGYGMDVLRSLGATGGVVTVGGSVGVLGKDVGVGIRDPFGTANTSFAVVQYSGAVASTSGVYERHFAQNGTNYHHILDPVTGYPVQSELVSVTVICPDGLASDALATACFKLGYEGSRDVLDAYAAMAVFVYRDKTVKTYNERYSFEIKDQSYEKQAG